MSKIYLPSDNYLLKTDKAITPVIIDKMGVARLVDKDSFPALNGVTCYCLEIWQECMRLPHWHPNASELGYVISGSIEVIIWRSPGETAVFTLTAGMCWFIPQSALHSLNNIGREPAKLFVGFSSERPQDMDLPVAFNGIPVPLRDAYTSPHSELSQWSGVNENPLLGNFPLKREIRDVLTASPYGFDLAKVTPLFSDPSLGSVVWAIKSNWSILENISILRARLNPSVARDAIWYPDVETLYVVVRGEAEFHMVIADHQPYNFTIKSEDYIFVPTGILHTFINNSEQDFEIIAFFTKPNPLPEVSLSVATAFFPNEIRKSAMTIYGNINNAANPLKDLKYTGVSPYLLPIKN